MIVGEAKSLPLTLRHAAETEKRREAEETLRRLIQFAAACVIAAIFSAVAVSCIHPGQGVAVRDPVALCKGVAAQAPTEQDRAAIAAACPLLVVVLESGVAPVVVSPAKDAGAE